MRISTLFTCFFFTLLVSGTSPLPPSTIAILSDLENASRDSIVIKCHINHVSGDSKVNLLVHIAEHSNSQIPSRELIHDDILDIEDQREVSVPIPPRNLGLYQITATVRYPLGNSNFGYLDSHILFLKISDSEKAELIEPQVIFEQENSRRWETQLGDLEPVISSQQHVLGDVIDPHQGLNQTMHLEFNFAALDGRTLPLSGVNITLKIHEDWSNMHHAYTVGWNITNANGVADFYFTTYFQHPDYVGTKWDIVLQNQLLDASPQAMGTPGRLPHKYSSTTFIGIPYRDIGGTWTFSTDAGTLSPSITSAWYNVWTLASNATSKTPTKMKPAHFWYPALVDGPQYYGRNWEIQAPMASADSFCALAHEYGHHCFYTWSNNWDANLGGQHSYCPFPQPNASYVHLALSEGWATAFGLVNLGSTDGKYYFGNRNSSFRELERYDCRHSRDVNYDEGRVAASLWDLWDRQDDCSNGDPNKGTIGGCDLNDGFQVDYMSMFYYSLVNSTTGQPLRPFNTSVLLKTIYDSQAMYPPRDVFANGVIRYNYGPYFRPHG